MLLLPVSSWLLCIWQARQVGATWWGVLITILVVQLSIMLLERLASSSNTSYGEHLSVCGWPELLRASVGITLTVYVVKSAIIDFLPSSGEGTSIVMMLLVLAGVMDYEFPFSWRSHVLISLVAIIAVCLREWGDFIQAPVKPFNFIQWLQFFLSMHAMMVGHTVSAERPVIYISPYVRIACALSVSLFATMQYRRTIFSLMILPSIFFREKNAIVICITPILDTICNSELYPLQDPRKAESRRVLLIQQKQELLFYIMAWCVALGLWAHLRPSVLIWVQIIGGILYLASLRRYSNVIKILDYNHNNHNNNNNHREYEYKKVKTNNNNEDNENVTRRKPVNLGGPEALLTRMMQHSSMTNNNNV
jgi:hypothetical protein